MKMIEYADASPEVIGRHVTAGRHRRCEARGVAGQRDVALAVAAWRGPDIEPGAL